MSLITIPLKAPSDLPSTDSFLQVGPATTQIVNVSDSVAGSAQKLKTQSKQLLHLVQQPREEDRRLWADKNSHMIPGEGGDVAASRHCKLFRYGRPCYLKDTTGRYTVSNHEKSSRG